jgi:hypothetical protein
MNELLTGPITLFDLLVSILLAILFTIMAVVVLVGYGFRLGRKTTLPAKEPEPDTSFDPGPSGPEKDPYDEAMYGVLPGSEKPASERAEKVKKGMGRQYE